MYETVRGKKREGQKNDDKTDEEKYTEEATLTNFIQKPPFPAS